MQIKKMILLRSLPGGGKSTIAQQYKEKYTDSCFICSTDDYWMRPDGIYDFNFELLKQSHMWNQYRVAEILEADFDVPLFLYDSYIIVDNTNITFNEMKPYIQMGLNYDYEIEFIEPDTEWKYDVEECFKRNGHGVPYATILKMSQRWEDHDTVTRKLKELKDV